MKSSELRKLKNCKVKNYVVFAGQTEDLNPRHSWVEALDSSDSSEDEREEPGYIGGFATIIR